MPREPLDYSKCVIYKIVCNDENVLELYVGHTTNFVKRKYQHKCSCKSNNLKVYQMIREHGGFDNWTMTPICEYPCENYIQACIKEEEYRIKLQAQLNMIRAYLSKELLKELLKEQKKEYDKIYREENIEHIKDNYKKYRSSPTFVKKRYPEKEKEWREINVEHIKEYNKQYAQENKDEINEQRRLRYAQKKLVQSSEK